MVNLYPAFTIHPEESGATAVRRLQLMVPDLLFFRGSHAYGINPLASDASVYSYGSDHALLWGRYGTPPDINWVQVYGKGVMSQGFIWDGLEQRYARLLQVHDLNLDTLARAQERRDAELRRLEMAACGGEIEVPASCGQELYDVIDITDSGAGLSQAKRRVVGLNLAYLPGEARYVHRLRLGGV